MQDGFERYLAVCCNGEVENITANGRISAEFAERHPNHAIQFVHQKSRDGKDWPSVDPITDLERAVIEAAIELRNDPTIKVDGADITRTGIFGFNQAVDALLAVREKQQ